MEKRIFILFLIITLLFSGVNYYNQYNITALEMENEILKDQMFILQTELEESNAEIDTMYETIEDFRNEVQVKLYKSKIDMIDYIDIEFKNDLLSILRTEFQLKQEEEEALIKRLEEETKKRELQRQKELEARKKQESPKPVVKEVGKFQYYSQLDSRWAEIKYSWAKAKNAGCGPTSLAMILNYYSNELITPKDTVNISKENKLDLLAPPRTNMPELLKIVSQKYKVNYKTITKDDIMPELEKGRTVMVGTHKNPLINYKNKGHYIVLRGLDKNGNIIVNDPYANNTYDKPADSSVEGYKNRYVYVTTPEHLYPELFEIYSFWGNN